ncbi:MAG TPA: pyridoxal 5'-phosphate synthase [Cellulomonas sp.]
MTGAPDPFLVPPDEPFALLRDWVATARADGVREPLAVTLATAGSDGHVAGRTVVLRAVDADGVLLTSMRTATKGRQLRENPWAAVTAYWREVGRQVNLAGPVHEVDGAPADALFAAMPRPAQAATALSVPGAPLTDEAALRRRAEALVAAERPIPRPTDWVGYRIAPEQVELWQSSPQDRLHRRLRYERTATGWTVARLQP